MTAFRNQEEIRAPKKMPTHLKPFLNRLETCLRYRILPVPVVFRRLAFCPHSNERSFALGYPHCAQAVHNKNPTIRQGLATQYGIVTKKITNFCVVCGRSDCHSGGKACATWCGAYWHGGIRNVIYGTGHKVRERTRRRMYLWKSGKNVVSG